MIRQRLREIDEERSRLQRAIKSLSEPKLPQGRVSPGRRRTRAKRGQRPKQFLRALPSAGDARLSESAREMGVPTGQVSSLARQLVEQGEIEKVARGRYRRAQS